MSNFCDPDIEKYLLKPYLIKLEDFAFEKEVRVVTDCTPNDSSTTKGLLIKNIDPVKLIEEVMLSPLLTKPQAKAIRRGLKGKFPENLITQSKHKGYPDDDLSGTMSESKESDLPPAIKWFPED
jgi:hypothetical protein